MHNMLMEAITISSIMGASALAVWFAKGRFQPEIERSLTKIEAATTTTTTTEQETIAARHRPGNKTNKE
jgi:hypothetical protein